MSKQSVWSIPSAFITIGLPVIAFVAGALTNAYTIASSIATKTEVKAVLVDAEKYTDERVANATRELRDYSDSNRSKTLIDVRDMITPMIGEQKSQGSQINMILRTLSEMHDDSMRQAQKQRK